MICSKEKSQNNGLVPKHSSSLFMTIEYNAWMAKKYMQMLSEPQNFLEYDRHGLRSTLK